MCCEMPIRPIWHHPGWCYCFPRRFLTKEEQIERLEGYAKSLEKELSGVREYIEELKKESPGLECRTPPA